MKEDKEGKEDHFEVLRKISKKPEASQRELAQDLGFSLGKLNYCIKEALKYKNWICLNLKKAILWIRPELRFLILFSPLTIV